MGNDIVAQTRSSPSSRRNVCFIARRIRVERQSAEIFISFAIS